jgi:hypothetical protein
MPDYLVVTQEPIDVLIISAILGIRPGEPHIEVIDAGGWSAADSYARTALVENEADVALVVDADTSDHNQAEERRRFLIRSLGSIPTRRRFSVSVIEPDITNLLFRDHGHLTQLLGSDVPETDLIRAQFDSRQVLSHLLGSRFPLDTLRTRLATIDWSDLRKDPALQALVRFLKPKRVSRVLPHVKAS